MPRNSGLVFSAVLLFFFLPLAAAQTFDCLSISPRLVAGSQGIQILDNAELPDSCDLRVSGQKSDTVTVTVASNPSDLAYIRQRVLNSIADDENNLVKGSNYKYVNYAGEEFSPFVYAQVFGNCVMAIQANLYGDAPSEANSVLGVANEALTNPRLVQFCNSTYVPEATASPSPALESPTPAPGCEVKGEIVFEPTQGVWQDDYSFAPAPGRQIVRLERGVYRAELPMVVGRHTLIFGLKGAGQPGVANDVSRKTIRIDATTTGTVPVNSKVVFSIAQAGSKKTVYETAAEVPLPLEPPCGPEKNFTYLVAAGLGLPPAGDFTFDKNGAYELKATLLRGDDGAATGVQTTVSGDAVETFGPRVHFVPATISPPNPANQNAFNGLIQWTRSLAEASRDYIPDYYPLAQGRLALPVGVYSQLHSFYPQVKAADESWGAWFLSIGRNATVADAIYKVYRQDALSAALVNEIGTGAELGHADRIVVVLPSGEIPQLINLSIVGLSISKKVMLAVYLPNMQVLPHDTIAHELAHTMPYIWSRDQMISQCGLDYHNTLNPVAHGFRITYGSAPAARVHVAPGTLEIMGNGQLVAAPVAPGDAVYNANAYTEWISQCTYSNLAQFLQKRPDPQLLLVRGMLARFDGGYYAQLSPAYEIGGVQEAGGSGSWQLIAKDAGGAELGKYSFEPEWKMETEGGIAERNVVAFSQRILFDERVRTVELRSPEGLEATLEVSGHAPSVAITSPQNNSFVEPSQDGVEVKWDASDADGGQLKHTVLYSSDGGENWQAQVFETAETSAKITLGDAADHLVKVITTDGARSSESEVAFNTRAQTEPSGPENQPENSGANAIVLPSSVDLSFILPEIRSLLGEGMVKIEIFDGGQPSEYWFSVGGGSAARVDAPQDGKAALTISMRKSVFIAIANSIDSQNAAKLALRKQAAIVNSEDVLKQSAIEGGKSALDAKEFSPEPGSAVEFHGRQATAVAGPAGYPALSIPGEDFMPVMNKYGSPLGATSKSAAQLSEKSKLPFSQTAGIVAAEPSTGRPLLWQASGSKGTAQSVSSAGGESAAKSAYRGAVSAKKAYDSAIKKT